MALPLSAFKGKAGLVKLDSQTLAAAAAWALPADLMGAAYSSYLLEAFLTVATDDREIWARVSQDNGATVKSGGTDYDYRLFGEDANANINRSSAGDSKIVVAGGTGAAVAVGNATGECASVRLRIDRPAAAALYKLVQIESMWVAASGALYWHRGAGRYIGNANAIDGLQVLAESGNLSGVFNFYGIRG